VSIETKGERHGARERIDRMVQHLVEHGRAEGRGTTEAQARKIAEGCESRHHEKADKGKLRK